MPLALEINGLTITAGAEPVVRGIHLQLHAGAAFTVLGESGSGKSLMAQAVMGTLPSSLAASGDIALWGRRLLPGTPRDWGIEVAMLPQEPWLSLNPSMHLHAQVAEVRHCVRGQPWPAARLHADQALAQVDLSPARHKYPHQISGGMGQRLAFAATRASGAKLLIADEPTKGLVGL